MLGTMLYNHMFNHGVKQDVSNEVGSFHQSRSFPVFPKAVAADSPPGKLLSQLLLESQESHGKLASQLQGAMDQLDQPPIARLLQTTFFQLQELQQQLGWNLHLCQLDWQITGSVCLFCRENIWKDD